MKTPYSYTILRYVHDSMTGEFVNVGIVICSPAQRFVKAELRHTYGGRIAKMFPGFDGKHFKSLVSQMETAFNRLSEKLAEDLQMEEMPKDAFSAATRILPADDSAFQWSPMGSGLSNDLTETLAQLFDRLVLKYDDKNTAESRSDDVIWQSFKKDFEQYKILSHLTPKKIQSADGEIEFDHAWENGQWHCFEPISFDLVNPTSIADKACMWLGRLTNVKQSEERFKLYCLVGEPQHDQCRVAFEKAVVTLKKAPNEIEVIRESEAAAFSARLASRIAEHDHVS